MSPKVSPERVRLGARLRELRASAFRSGSALARHLGWQQTRINKLEHGYQLPSPADLDAWVAAVEASPRVRAELGDLLTKARIQYSSWAEVYRCGGIAGRQAEIGATEARAALLRGYQPSLIPGIVQTVAYARELLTIPGGPVLTGATPERIEALIAERVKRQELLYVPGRQVQIVLGEAALTVHFGALDTLLGQLDRLVILAGLASVDLRVLPWAVASPVMPLSGFWLDADAVYIETLTGEQELTGPDDIAVYAKAFELLRTAALAGEDAAALIQRVAAELRSPQ
ncbi:MAG: helix-turn-helix domain-containing protein [Pseudonocardiaceae bacterium]